jgi:hypothetical protein
MAYRLRAGKVRSLSRRGGDVLSRLGLRGGFLRGGFVVAPFLLDHFGANFAAFTEQATVDNFKRSIFVFRVCHGRYP